MATNKEGRRLLAFQTDLHVKNILPDIVFVDGNLNEAHFLAWLNQLPMVTTVTKEFQFYEDDWLPLTDTTAASVTATETDITVTTPLAYIPGLLYKNATTGEVVMVTAQTGSHITVVRGVGRDSTNSTGTAAAAMASGETLIRLGPAQGEHSNRQSFQSTVPTKVFNYAEKMRVDIIMSDWQRKQKHVTGRDWDYQLDKAFKQFRKDLNVKLYAGERNSTTINGQVHYFTGGLDFFISTNVLTSSGTLYEYAWDDFLNSEGLRYGSSDKLCLGSMKFIQAITEMAKDKITITRANLGTRDMAMGVNVIEYIAPNGKLTIAEDRALTAAYSGHARIIDLDVVRLRDFSGDGIDGRPRLIPNTQDPDSDDYVSTILADIGLEVGPEKHHAKITGVTTGGMAGRAVS